MGTSLDIVSLLRRKRDGESVAAADLEAFVQGYMQGEVTDYHMAAFAMAVYYKGMLIPELAAFTHAIASSGNQWKLSSCFPFPVVDKHSTGGVADSTTLILAPMVASVGVPVGKLSGAGLGHTGGTTDKLSAIPGMTTKLSFDRFIEQIKEVQVAVMGTTMEVAPADGRLYALRDVTATVDSLPLIASSIMGKKLALGASAIVLDVKMGKGACLPQEQDAIQLAEIMVQLGEAVGCRVVALVTEMEQPLGCAIGNALELQESFEILQGSKNSADLRELSLLLGGQMVYLGDKAMDPQEGRDLLEKSLQQGHALDRCKAWIRAQGGDDRVVTDFSLLPQALQQHTIYSDQSGRLLEINALTMGRISSLLGSGRQHQNDIIDLAAGIRLHVRQGERVERGAALATLYTNREEVLPNAIRQMQKSFLFEEGEGIFPSMSPSSSFSGESSSVSPTLVRKIVGG